MTILDSQVLTTFVERWHNKTSFFHLPFGEMTITLDDVSSLFHLPLAGSFIIASLISQHLSHIIVVHDLRVTEAQVIKEFRVNISAYF